MKKEYWTEIYCDHEYEGKKHKSGMFRIYPTLANGRVTLLIDNPRGNSPDTGKKERETTTVTQEQFIMLVANSAFDRKFINVRMSSDDYPSATPAINPFNKPSLVMSDHFRGMLKEKRGRNIEFDLPFGVQHIFNGTAESTESGSSSLESDMVSESEPFLGTSENSIRQSMSIEEFQAQLDRRSETGQAGEQIAFDDELRRLKTDEVGCLDPERYVKHVALNDVGRGYDIESTWPGHERCIEVKSSTSFGNDIFMSENERSTLKELGKKAWLYRVVIDANGNGEVVLRLNDPVSEIPEENFSTAVWRVRLPRPDK